MTSENNPENHQQHAAQGSGQISDQINLKHAAELIIEKYRESKAKAENFNQERWRRETAVGEMWALSYVMGVLHINIED